MRNGIPFAPPKQRVGLLGGSFNPAHAGHVHISRLALTRLRLDRVWWLLSPGNPLKPNPPASLTRRLAAARKIIDHPGIIATDIEHHLGTVYTYDTLTALQAQCPHVTFIWLMGADNLSQFHRWKDWAKIMTNIPVAVMARPGEQVKAGLSPAARRFAPYRVPQADAPTLARRSPPCWTMLSHPMSPLSSTELRNSGAWT